MAVYLNELQVGRATDVVGFPHLLVCMGVLALTANEMYGLHIDTTKPAEKATAYAQFWAFMQQKNAGAVVAIYGCCNHAVRYSGSANAVADWQTEMALVAASIGGYHGPARGFDTSIIAPQNGTYVEYQPRFAQSACSIFYKRHEKMNHGNVNHTTAAALNPDVAKISLYKQALVPVYTETVSADIKRTWSNKGLLHEVDYANRLMAFNV